MLTQKQADELKNSSLFGFGFTTDFGTDLGLGFMGLELSDVRPPSIEIPPETPIPENPHPLTNLLEINNNGEVFGKQFEIEHLQKRFPKSQYDIKETEENGNRTIRIINKSSKKLELEYIFFAFSPSISIINHMYKEGATVIKDFNSDNYTLSSINKEENGNHVTSIFDHFNGEITSKSYFNPSKKQNEPYKIEKYSNGEIYAIQENNKIKAPIADDITEALNQYTEEKNEKNQQILLDTLSRLTEQNTIDILKAYKDKNGVDLLEKLSKIFEEEIGWSVKDPEIYDGPQETWETYHKILDNIKFFNIDNIDYIVERLDSEIYSPDNLLICFEMIDETNATLVAQRYQEKTGRGLMSDIITKIPEFGSNKEIFVDTLSQYSENFNKETLLGILNSDIDYLMNRKEAYVEDIKLDMKQNRMNEVKQLVDLRRFLNRSHSMNPDGEMKYQLKAPFNQGSTGDCWLLGDIISLAEKTHGIAHLDKLTTPDENGNITVSLPGAEKEYFITKEEIENFDHLSDGNAFVRAIEIAVDKYMKEAAYDGASNVDINGNSLDFGYRLLIGYGFETEFDRELAKDFNRENEFYCVGFYTHNTNETTRNKYAVATNNSGECFSFVSEHAYGVVGSDDKYVYIKNPYNSEEKLKIEHEALEQLNARVGVSSLGI